MVMAQAYYPNTEGLTNENGKEYRYAYKGEGFSNKRSLHMHMVTCYLNEQGKEGMERLVENGIKKLGEIYPDDGDTDLIKKLNVGFFNRTQGKVHHDLERLVEEIRENDIIEVIAFNMPFGSVTRLDGFVINKGDLSQSGQSLVGSNLDYPKGTQVDYNSTLPTEVNEPESQTLRGGISTDPLA